MSGTHHEDLYYKKHSGLSNKAIIGLLEDYLQMLIDRHSHVPLYVQEAFYEKIERLKE